MKLELSDVSARHPAAKPGVPHALRALSLQVQSGEALAVIGPSGAGKTTLLQVLACSMPPLAGRCAVDGVDPWSLPRSRLQALRGTLFLAPQVPPLPPRQRVVTSVLAAQLPAMSLARSLRSLFYPVDIPSAHEALEAFDLAEKIFDRVDRLSGGERQRVGLARTLLAPARLWLMDEPLSSLDPTRARQAVATLVQRAQARGVTLIATLHHVEMALAHFPRIVGLRDGALAFDLPTAEVTRERLAQLYAQHEHEMHGGPVPVPPEAAGVAAGRAPAAMHCR